MSTFRTLPYKILGAAALVALAICQSAFAQTPIITPKSNIVLKLDNSGNHTVLLSEIATVLNPDGTTPTDVTFTPTIFDCSKVGIQSVTVTATNRTAPDPTAAKFYKISYLAVDAVGNLYVTESGNNSIRKISTNGQVTTIAGGTSGYLDANGRNAKFDSPNGIAIDAAGNLFVADGSSGSRIRKIAPNGDVTTFAGGTPAGSVDGPGLSARFNVISGMAFDNAGNLFVEDIGAALIRKVSPAAQVTTIAGQDLLKGYIDGTGSGAIFTQPLGIAIDPGNNLYITEYAKLRKMTPAAVVTTIVSNPVQGYADGPLATSRFNGISGVVIDAQGNLYVSDANNNRIRKINTAGIVSTFAGSGVAGFTNGAGTAATFNGPGNMAIDQAGNIYVVEGGINNDIRKITPDGTVSTLAGGPVVGFSDGNIAGTITGTATQTISVTVVSQPQISTHANVIVGSDSNCAGVVPNFTGEVTASSCANANLPVTQSPAAGTPMALNTPITITLTANDAFGGSASTTFTATYKYSAIITPVSPNIKLMLDATGSYQTKVNDVASITTCDNSNPTITLSPLSFDCNAFGPQTITVTAANGTPPTPNNATFSRPASLALDAAGNIYVSDPGNFAVRKINTNGDVSTLAGGTRGYLDATGTTAQFNYPQGVAVDASGNVFVADLNNFRIREILPDGTVSSFVGGGTGPVDGTGAAARFNFMSGLVFDNAGNLYAADAGNSLIRKVSPAGQVTTIAGQYGVRAYTDGTGTGAAFTGIGNLAIDPNNNLYIADQQKLRKMTPAGVVTTITPNTIPGYADGPLASARFQSIAGVVLDAQGNIYVSDYADDRIRKISTLGIVSTFAGSGAAGTANGVGAAASFNGPGALAIDAAGNLYVSESFNNDIRKITPDGTVSTLAGKLTAGFTNGNVGGTITTSVTKTFNVTVVRQPIIAPHADVTIAADASCNALVPDFKNDLQITTCPGAIFTYTQVPAAGTALAINTPTTITITATDQYGDQASVSFKVTARAKPVITPLAPPITIKLDATGNYTAKLADLATVTMCDNSPTTVTISPATIDCSKLGPQIFTITAKNNINVADPAVTTTTAQVNVNVITTVTINSTFADVNIPVNAPCPTFMPDYISGATGTSNCGGIVSFTQLPAAGSLITGTNPITVTITAKDNSGTIATKSFKLTPDSGPSLPAVVTITASSQNICDGTAVLFNAVPANFSSTPTYQWLVNGTPDVNATNGNTYSNSTLKDGDIVSCRAFTTAGCIVSVTSNPLTIKVNTNLKVDVSVTASSLDICTGTIVTFTAKPVNQGANPTYKWFVNGIANTVTTPTFTTGTLINGDLITCSVTNNDGSCLIAKEATSAAVTMKVTPYTTPTLSISPAFATTVCAGTAINFTASTNVSSPSYQWQINNRDVTGAIGATFSPTTLLDGDVVTCTIVIADKCVTVRTITSNTYFASIINPFTLSPVISTADINICNGQPVTFTADAPGAPGSVVLNYKWLVNNAEVVNSTSQTFTIASLKDNDVVTCMVNVTNGCVGPFTSNSLTVHAPSVVFASAPTIINKGESVTLSPIITGNIVSYRWSPAAGLSDPTIANPIATPDLTTTYQLTVTSSSGCQASASITIPVLVPINIPNAFSPNGDGINDQWNISALANYPNNVVDIFDRYGRLVLHSTGYSKSWDGTQNGSTLPVGVYYYVIDPKSVYFKPLTGWVAIIR